MGSVVLRLGANIVWVISGNAMQIIGLNYWIRQFGGKRTGVFTTLCVSNFVFASFFLMYLLVYVARHRPPLGWVLQPEALKTLFWIGLFDSIGSWLIIYSTRGTPELLQTIFFSLAPVFTVFSTKFVLRDTRSYCNLWILAAFSAMLASAAIAAYPDLVGGSSSGEVKKGHRDGDDEKKGHNHGSAPAASRSGFSERAKLWSLFYLLAIPMQCMYNVLQTKYMRNYTLVEVIEDEGAISGQRCGMACECNTAVEQPTQEMTAVVPTEGEPKLNVPPGKSRGKKAGRSPTQPAEPTAAGTSPHHHPHPHPHQHLKIYRQHGHGHGGRSHVFPYHLDSITESCGESGVAGTPCCAVGIDSAADALHEGTHLLPRGASWAEGEATATTAATGTADEAGLAMQWERSGSDAVLGDTLVLQRDGSSVYWESSTPVMVTPLASSGGQSLASSTTSLGELPTSAAIAHQSGVGEERIEASGGAAATVVLRAQTYGTVEAGSISGASADVTPSPSGSKHVSFSETSKLLGSSTAAKEGWRVGAKSGGPVSLYGVDGCDDATVKAVMLCGDTCIQALLCLFLLPADALPWFGQSASVVDAWSNLLDGISCVIHCPYNALYCMIFSAGYIFTYVGAASLNHYSATLSAFVGQLASPTTAVVLLVFPFLNVNAGETSVFNSVVAVILMVIGTVVYTTWEERTVSAEERKLSSVS